MDKYSTYAERQPQQAIAALKARKRSVLSYVEWKTVPWRHQRKSPKDLLIDILVDIPSLLEDVDIMQACKDANSKEEQRQRLLGRCYLFDRRLAEWYSSQWPDGTSPPSYRPNTPLGEVCSLKLEDLSSAHLMTLYWSTCLALYITMPLVLGAGDALPEHADPRIYILKITDTLPLLLHRDVGVFRLHLATFPMGVVYKCLQAMAPDEMVEQRIILAKLFEQPESVTMSKFISSMESNA